MMVEELARSTVFRFPSKANNMNNLNSHNLAILQTCQQLYSESKSLFLRHSLLDCRGTENCLDVLSVMTTEQRKSVRFLKFTGTPIVLHKAENLGGTGMGLEYSVYSAQVVLQLLFPELRLDTLVFLDPHHGPSDWVLHSGRHFGDYQAYSQVTELVKYGNGWNTLHYISTNTAFLQTITSPQPITWDTCIKARDGESSGACTDIFISKKGYGEIAGPELSSNMWETLDMNVLKSEVKNLEDEPNEELAWYRDNKVLLKRSVLVKVCRGKGADHDGGASLQGVGANVILKRLYEQQGWKGLKEDKLKWFQVMPYGQTNGEGQT